MVLKQKATYNGNEPDNNDGCGSDHLKVGLKSANILAKN